MAKKKSNLDDIIAEAYADGQTTNETIVSDAEKLDDKMSEELREAVSKAIPYKTETLTTNSQDMNEVTKDFASTILQKLNKSKDKELFKHYKKVFKIIKDFMYYVNGVPKETSIGRDEKLVECLSILIPWLQYLGKDADLKAKLLENGISISNTIPLENREGFEFLKEQSIKNQLTGFFEESRDIQDTIHENTKAIISDCYEELPEDLKFDKDNNPTGLKPAQFNKLVSVVTKMQLDNDNKDEIQNKAVYQLECLGESTKLLKESIIENS